MQIRCETQTHLYLVETLLLSVLLFFWQDKENVGFIINIII